MTWWHALLGACIAIVLAMAYIFAPAIKQYIEVDE